MSYVDVKGKATSKKTVVYIWISLALSRNFHAHTETVRPLRGAALQKQIPVGGALHCWLAVNTNDMIEELNAKTENALL